MILPKRHDGRYSNALLHPIANEVPNGHRRDCALGRANPADVHRRHADRLGQPVLADVQWLQKLLTQHFAGMNITVRVHHGHLSVIIANLDTLGIPVVPNKANPPWVVDADAKLPRAVAGDSVMLNKDLKVKGSSVTLKMGTKAKNIRWVGGDHEVDCRTDSGPFMLKAAI